MKLHFFFLFLVIPVIGISQNKAVIDSLEQALKTAASDSSRVKALYGLAWELKYSDPAQATRYAQECLDLADRMGWKAAAGNAQNTLGIINDVLGRYPEAISYYRKYQQTNQELGDSAGIAIALNNLGTIFKNISDYPQALEHFLQSLTISEKAKDRKRVASALNNIGLVYENLGDYDRAQDYYEKSLEIKKDLGDKRSLAIAHNNLGIIFKNKKEYDEALAAFEKSLEIAEETGDRRVLVHVLGNFGNTFKETFKHPQALDYYKKSLAVAEQQGDRYVVATLANKIGQLYKENAKTEEATQQAWKAIQIAREIGVPDQEAEGLKLLSDIYRQKKQYELAMNFQDQYLLMKDSLARMQNEEEVARIEMRNEYQKQHLKDSLAREEERLRIELAHQEAISREKGRKRIYLFSGIGILVVSLGLWNRLLYTRKAKAAIEQEKDRSESLLLNILPAEIAQELKQNGKAAARGYDEVSILFTDFKDFTQMSEQLSAESLVEEINQCFQAFDTITSKYKIEKIKTIGDAYMAAGGLPVPAPDSVINTVRAAWEMQQFMTQRRHERAEQGLPAFSMRVGIHTGPVVAGIVGVKKFQYDIWGDTVNIASRIESSGEAEKINISQNTYEHIKDNPDFSFTYRGKVKAKNKGAVDMYFVEVGSRSGQ